METKICSKCGIEKQIKNFRKTYNKKYDKYYYRTECHDCELLYGRKYELTRKDRNEYKKEYSKKYRNKNRDLLSQKNKRWREKNKDQLKLKSKEYYDKNKDIIVEKAKEYYKKNKNKILDYHHKYNKDNSKLLVEKAYIYQKKKVSTDELYKFKRVIRACILSSFKRKNHRKQSLSKDILGIDLDDAWEYLKETWKSNYKTKYNGEPYHIDHIVPLSTAKNEEDVIRLCHYTNLQLLKPEDNLEKSDRVDWKINE